MNFLSRMFGSKPENSQSHEGDSFSQPRGAQAQIAALQTEISELRRMLMTAVDNQELRLRKIRNDIIDRAVQQVTPSSVQTPTVQVSQDYSGGGAPYSLRWNVFANQLEWIAKPSAIDPSTGNPWPDEQWNLVEGGNMLPMPVYYCIRYRNDNTNNIHRLEWIAQPTTIDPDTNQEWADDLWNTIIDFTAVTITP